MARRHHLIITVDYELFGDGSGCVRNCVCAPLERMARLVEKYGGRLEIFVEAVEFAAMEREPEYAGAVAAVKRQLADMLARGHGIQLHIHPQWQGAIRSGGQWSFESHTWRTGDVGGEALFALIKSAHAWLGKALEDVSPNYKPHVFRAGGWCIQPSEEVVSVLKAVGVRADSSVAPGLMSRDPGSWYDFRDSPAMSWWRVDADVDLHGGGDFVEVPIAVGRVSVARHLWARLARRRQGEFAPECHGKYRGRSSRVGRMAALWHKARNSRSTMLDFCVLPLDLMVDVIKNWRTTFSNGDVPIPVVAIGHTKNFSRGAESELEKLLIWVGGQEGLTVGSYRSWHEEAVSGSVEQ